MQSAGNAVRYPYNHFLQVNIDENQLIKKFFWQADMCKQLTQLNTAHKWTNPTYSQVIQPCISDLVCALKDIGAGLPKFKNKYITPVIFRCPQNVSITNDRLYPAKIGHIKIVLYGDLPPFKGVAVIQTPSRGWLANFVVDGLEQPLVENITQPVVGDVNSKLTALSTSVLLSTHKPLVKKQSGIRLLHVKLSSKQNAGKNNIQAKNKQLRTHDLVRCPRSNHLSQTSARIAKSHDPSSVATLNMDKIRHQSKPAVKCIADAGWTILAGSLAYKLPRPGHPVRRINQWLLSSKPCAAYVAHKSHWNLTQREYYYDDCTITQHRHLNAEVRISNWEHQQCSMGHAGLEMLQEHVDVVTHNLTDWGLMSSTTLEQEVTAPRAW